MGRTRSPHVIAHMTPELKNAIEEIADDMGISQSELVKKYIVRGMLIDEVLDTGGRVVAILPNGSRKTIVDQEMEVRVLPRLLKSPRVRGRSVRNINRQTQHALEDDGVEPFVHRGYD